MNSYYIQRKLDKLDKLITYLDSSNEVRKAVLNRRQLNMTEYNIHQYMSDLMEALEDEDVKAKVEAGRLFLKYKEYLDKKKKDIDSAADNEASASLILKRLVDNE